MNRNHRNAARPARPPQAASTATPNQSTDTLIACESASVSAPAGVSRATHLTGAATMPVSTVSAPPRLDLSLLISALPEDYRASEVASGEYLVEGPVDPQVLATVTAWCAQIDVLATDMRVEQRSLEDVFLELTGRELRA